MCKFSDLVTFNTALELNLSEPVVVGGLSLVVSESEQEGGASDVALNRLVAHDVDDLLLVVSSAGHF